MTAKLGYRNKYEKIAFEILLPIVEKRFSDTDFNASDIAKAAGFSFGVLTEMYYLWKHQIIEECVPFNEKESAYETKYRLNKDNLADWEKNGLSLIILIPNYEQKENDNGDDK